MALFASSLVPVSPAKTCTRVSTSSALILRTLCLIVRLRSPLPMSSSLSAKPISRSSFASAPRASPTQKFVYPDPNPQFAEFETQKFKAELLKKLLEDKDEFGDDLEKVIDVCAQGVIITQVFLNDCKKNLGQVTCLSIITIPYEIFCEFLSKEYGGPGTLLVEPFTGMFVALKKKKLPGARLAARASLLWAQNYVDKDWDVWNSRLK